MTNSKHELRSSMRALRKQLAAANPHAAEQAAQHLPGLLDMMFAGPGDFADEQKHRRFTAAVYKAQGSELDALPLAKALIERNVDLALPVATAQAEPLVFRRWSPRDPLEPDASGVPAPLPLAEAVVPDVIFVPLLAVDGRGYRLGQGGGYYDRTLSALRKAETRGWAQPWFIGLCYAGQIIEKVSEEAHDMRLHGVLTETGHQACIWH